MLNYTILVRYNTIYKYYLLLFCFLLLLILLLKPIQFVMTSDATTIITTDTIALMAPPF